MANEEDTVEQFLDLVLIHVRAADRVFCVLDNVCVDGTRQIVARRAEGDSRVNLVWAPENRCVVDAYFRGYREALAAGCDVILEMDAGMSHTPADIPRFLDAMAQGFDFAAGSRFLQPGCYRGRWSRYTLSRGGTILANLLLGTRMKDMTSGFECFTREAMQFVVDHGVQSRAHFFQTEIRHLLHDWNWTEVPITYTNPSQSVGMGTIREALRNLWRLRRTAKCRAREPAEVTMRAECGTPAMGPRKRGS
jgi:dolichol-phosphate mannosyltransferase